MPTVWLLPTLPPPQLKVARILFGSFIPSGCVFPALQPQRAAGPEGGRKRAGSWGCDKVEAILSHALPLAAPKRPELPFALIWLDYEGKHWVTGYLLRSYEGPC